MVVRELIWSARALKENKNLLDYLLNEWGGAIILQVIDKTNYATTRISQNPEQFPVFIKSKKISRCVMSPQTTINFRINKDSIEILSLYDNKQHPNKRKL